MIYLASHALNQRSKDEMIDLKVALGGNMSGKAFALMIDAVDEKDLTLEDAVKVSISASLLDGAIH